MDRRTRTWLVLGVMCGLLWGSGALVSAEDACHGAPAPPNPQQIYRQEKQAQIQQLQTQLQALRGQLKSTTDPATKTALRTQLHSLEEHQCDLMIDLAQHQVQWDQENVTTAEQHVTKAQQQLASAQEHLAKLQARKASMEGGAPVKKL